MFTSVELTMFHASKANLSCSLRSQVELHIHMKYANELQPWIYKDCYLLVCYLTFRQNVFLQSSRLKFKRSNSIKNELEFGEENGLQFALDWNSCHLKVRLTPDRLGALQSRCKTRSSATLTCPPPPSSTPNQFRMSDFSASHSLCLHLLASREWAHFQPELQSTNKRNNSLETSLKIFYYTYAWRVLHSEV
jgi:hypothetical protein